MGFLKFLILSNLLLILPIPLHSSNTYNVGDSVPIFVNKIGPLRNPSETYQYYEFAFCRPGMVIEKMESLGEILNGDRLANTLYQLEFAVNKTHAVLCQQKLSKADVAKFRDAIMNEFHFQMYYDDLPLWAFIGKVEDESWTGSKGPKYFLFTHVHFDALYNGNHVIEIHAFSDPNRVVDITEDADISVEFTYSVFWNETATPYKIRMDRYSGASLVPILQQTRWFSFINSIVIVILLIGLLTLLFTRHLKNDLKKWSFGDEEEDKEVGQKYSHGDVLKNPTNLSLFSAILGIGTQLLTLVSVLFILAFLGVLYPYSHGALSTSSFIAYILTSVIAGYSSASFCSQKAETGWERSVLLSGIFFHVPSLVTALLLNILAAYFRATAALPLGTILVIFLLYMLFAIPLLALGGVVGDHYTSKIQSSPTTKKGLREIPSLAWYRKLPAQMFLGGLLPFSAIIFELHNLLATIWGYKIYTLPSNLFVTLIILVLLTAMVSICLTYFQLATEDHDWWWRSILRGGATAIFMFGYSIYFYLKSNMSGVLQTSFFFGYSACMCYAFFLMLGTVGFHASWLFVRRVYHAVKSE